MGGVFAAIGYTVSMAFALFWQIFWALNLGSLLSGIVRAVVPKSAITKLLPDDSARSITIAYEILVTTCWTLCGDHFNRVFCRQCSVGRCSVGRRKQLRWCENIKTFDCFMHSLRSWKNSTVCECTFSKM